MIYAMIVLFWCRVAFSVHESSPAMIRKGIAGIQFIGKNSLYIFLYHRLALDYFLCPCVMIENIWTKRIFYLLCMMGIPILENQLYMKLKRVVLAYKTV